MNIVHDTDVLSQLSSQPNDDDTTVAAATVEPSESGKKVSRNKTKKMKKKMSKQRKREDDIVTRASVETSKDQLNIDYQVEKIQLSFADPNYAHFMKIFEKFKLSDVKKDEIKEEPNTPLMAPSDSKSVDSEVMSAMSQIANVLKSGKEPAKLEEDDDDDKGEETAPTMSKKKLRKLNRLSVAELKQLVTRPDVVEMHDVTARDPKLLICLKSAKNTVPVPRHWNAKRKYLAGKRGFQKAPFDLPDFIKRTGIMEMREALQEKEDAQSMKTKMRGKIRPKMGKIDIDYQKLHDAFFKYQTKPKLGIHGDLYYEGKEQETRMKEKKPGDISDDLRSALGMPTNENKNRFPPPWLIAMQRYGPPPSYPNQRIPGLNAPIPEACSFGYHAGGWGKPPVDSTGRPLYGDVFGQENRDLSSAVTDSEIDKGHWGEMESESEEEEEEESEEEEEEAPDASGLITPGTEGLITPSGLTSLPAGLETPGAASIELRKKKSGADDDLGGETPQLYTVLQEKKGANIGASLMGSQHVYDIGATGSGSKKGRDDGVEMALDPSELDIVDTEAMQAKYEGALKESQKGGPSEDFSDLVAEHAAKQRQKRKVQQEKTTGKKHKEFKF
jgi:splicing factor 3B subunit 2